MTGVRARVRAELTAEIKAIARRQIASEGASSLSLRGIARELGMASSAIYRYFPGRDELLTALIVDAYDTIGMIAEQADAPVDRDDLMGRWRAVGHAAFRWADENTAEYALIFGTPVPGYIAPPDTIGPATRFTGVLVAILVDASSAGVEVPPSSLLPLSKRTTRDLRALVRQLDRPIDERLLFVGLHAWSSLIGTISLILFGHLQNVIDDHGAFFADIVDHLGSELFGAA
jgi:AcrR family transcriptional regulator